MNRRDFCSALAAAFGVSIVDPTRLIVPNVTPFKVAFDFPFLVESISVWSIEPGNVKLQLTKTAGIELPQMGGRELPNVFTFNQPFYIPALAEISMLGDKGMKTALHGVQNRRGELLGYSAWWKL